MEDDSKPPLPSFPKYEGMTFKSTALPSTIADVDFPPIEVWGCAREVEGKRAPSFSSADRGEIPGLGPTPFLDLLYIRLQSFFPLGFPTNQRITLLTPRPYRAWWKASSSRTWGRCQSRARRPSLFRPALCGPRHSSVRWGGESRPARCKLIGTSV